MAYGTLKCDNITFTNGGIDQTVTVSGIVQSISGNITATGTIQGATIIGTSTVSGATVTGDAGVFTTVTGGSAGFTTVTGTTVTGTTANFNTGTFTSQVSGATVTGNLAQFTTLTGGTAGFTTITGATVTGTTANFVTVSGTTVTGNAGQFTTITGTSAGFTTITGATVTGTVGNFGSGSAAAPSVSVGTTDNGIYSPGTDQVAISTNGTQRINIEADGDINIDSGGVFYDATNNRLAIGTTSPDAKLEVNADSTGSVELARLRIEGQTNNPMLRIFADEANQTVTLDTSGSVAGTELVFKEGGSEAARIDSSGRLLVGTSSALAAGNWTDSLLQIRGNLSGSNQVGKIALYRGITTAATTVDTGLAQLQFGSGDGGVGALIQANADASWTASPASYPGRLVFFTTADGASSPTERMRIDSAGFISLGGDTNTGLSNPSADNLAITTGGSERARIDSSGRLLVGTSSAIPIGGWQHVIQAESTPTTSIHGLSATRHGGTLDVAGAAISLARSRGTAPGAVTAVANNDALGYIVFAGANGTDFSNQAASIACFVDGEPFTSGDLTDLPGRLVFSTTADGASSPTERMRIRADGATCLSYDFFAGGDFTKAAVQAGSVSGKMIDVTAGASQLYSSRNSTSSVNHVVFYNPNGTVGSIATSASATAYNTSSDYRLKENVTPVTDGITRLQQLKPSRFNFIADPDTTVDGFLAHEVQSIVPEAITGEKDAVDADGNPEYQGIDQSKLVPLLTAALQEAIGEIESLKARVAALEAN